MWSRLFSLAQVSSWFSFSEEVEVARLAITFNKKLVEDSESTTIEEEIVSDTGHVLVYMHDLTDIALAHPSGLLAHRWYIA